MFPPSCSTFIFCDRDRSENFVNELMTTLGLRISRIIEFPKWNDRFRELADRKEPHRFLIVEPKTEAFDAQMLRDHWSKIDRALRPKIVLVSSDPEDDLSELEQFLDADAVVRQNFDRFEIGFVLNRLSAPAEAGQRQFPRVLVSVDVDVQNEEVSQPRRERSFNISVGGIFVRSDNPDPQDKFLDLAICLPHRPPIECSARVVHSNTVHQ
jgi:hypothetical protein